MTGVWRGILGPLDDTEEAVLIEALHCHRPVGWRKRAMQGNDVARYSATTGQDQQIRLLNSIACLICRTKYRGYQARSEILRNVSLRETRDGSIFSREWVCGDGKQWADIFTMSKKHSVYLYRREYSKGDEYLLIEKKNSVITFYSVYLV